MPETRNEETPADSAARAAAPRHGGVSTPMESPRDRRALPWLEHLQQDTRYALRILARSPGFTIPAVLTLALGIGLAVAMFTVFDAVLREPLPVSDQDRVVVLWGGQEGSIRKVPLTSEHFDRFREEAQTLSDVTGTLGASAWPHAARDRGDAISLGLAAVAGNFFDVLHTVPIAGRMLRPEDDAVGAAPVMVISERLWRTRFARDPGAIGGRITLHERELTYTIVGVAPMGLEYPAGSDAWVTWRPLFECPLEVVPLGRLKPGVTPALAARELRASFARETLSDRRELDAGASPLVEVIVGDVRPAVVVLSAAAALLLLIACLNLANLLLVRMLARSQEIGVRRALGAARGRILRQLLTESAVIALIGVLLGALFAHALLGTLVALAPPELPRLDALEVGGAPLGLASAVTALAAVVCGALPAIWASGRVSDVVRLGGSSNTPPPSARTAHQALVVFQVGLAIVVLTAAGLLGRTLQALHRIDAGFTTERVAMLRLAWPREKFDTGDKVAALYERMVPRIESLPDVISASPVNMAPFSGASAGWDGWFVPEGHLDAGAPPMFNMAVVGPGYFSTLKVPVLRGRVFTDIDREGSPRAAVVSERAARVLWPGDDPIGKRLSLGRVGTPDDWWTVVGLVAETRYRAFREPAPTVYLPHRQFVAVLPMVTTVAVRTIGEPIAALPAIRHTVAEIDRDVLVMSAAPLQELVSRQLAQPRLSATLLTVFSAGALLLAGVGLYAVLGYVVRQRMRELAIRTALGASPSRLRAMVLARAVALTGAGIVLGVAAALASGGLLQSQLYGVRAGDPATLATVAAVLVAVSMVAAYLPARRAAQVDPMTLMREG